MKTCGVECGAWSVASAAGVGKEEGCGGPEKQDVCKGGL